MWAEISKVQRWVDIFDVTISGPKNFRYFFVPNCPLEYVAPYRALIPRPLPAVAAGRRKYGLTDVRANPEPIHASVLPSTIRPEALGHACKSSGFM